MAVRYFESMRKALVDHIELQRMIVECREKIERGEYVSPRAYSDFVTMLLAENERLEVALSTQGARTVCLQRIVDSLRALSDHLADLERYDAKDSPTATTG